MEDGNLLHDETGRRRMLVAVVVFGVWGVIAGRLVQLQLQHAGRFAESAGRQRTFVEVLPARPGDVLDRRGRVLATSVQTRSFWIDLSRFPETDRLALQTASMLHLDYELLKARFRKHRNSRFVWVKRRLGDEEVARVHRLGLPPGTFGFRDEFQRYYPQGPFAAHVVGLRDIDGKGSGGVEQAYDSLLRGTPGRREMIRDAQGRIVDVLDDRERPAKDGRSLTLTIDTLLQIEVEREIDRLMDEWKPQAAGVILMDPQTAEVLAMASRPAFDPNRPVNVPPAAWKNINVASVFEPGSTFKPFVVGWALQQDAIRRDEEFHCEHGRYRMGRRLLHDHHPYGRLSVKDVLVKSSNIGMAKIGERLTNPGLYEAAERFGFGRRTGSGLPGEVSGQLRPLSEWTSYSTGSIPMGQELGVTPLQLITAHAALANGGTLISPQLVRKIGGEAADGDANSRAEPPNAGSPPRVVSQTVRREIADWLVREAMTDVVRRGTGKNARLDDYTVFGKTGTAQKIDPATGRYSNSRHVCSFIGGAPAENPRLLVLVVVDEPTSPGVHYGGTVAAPTAARVLQKSLRFGRRDRVTERMRGKGAEGQRE